MGGRSITTHAAIRDGDGQPALWSPRRTSISNIGLQLRKNSLIVDQLAASIVTLLAQLSGSRENARVSIGKHLPAWDEKAMEINRTGVPELVDGRDL